MTTESYGSAFRLQWVRPELTVIVGADAAGNNTGDGADGASSSGTSLG
jgi:hypothetical protein